MAPQAPTPDDHRDAIAAARVAAREALNLSPGAMAERLGITEAELVAWESDEPMGRRITDERLELAYRAPARWLRTGIDDVGTRIARLRMGKEITQVELAREIGAAVQEKGKRADAMSPTVQKWEQKGRAPSARFHSALERVLETTISYLLDGVGPVRAARPQSLESTEIPDRLAELAERQRRLEARVDSMPAAVERRHRRRMDDATRVENRVKALAEGQSVQAGLIRELTDDLKDLQQSRDDLATLVADLQRQLREGQG